MKKYTDLIKEGNEEVLTEGMKDKAEKEMFKMMGNLLMGKGGGLRDVYEYMAKNVSSGKLKPEAAMSLLKKMETRFNNFAQGAKNMQAELADMKEDFQFQAEALVEGYTLDIVATFKKDSKEGPITIYKDEMAEIYCVKNKYDDKGVFFTAKQWKEMKNAMKLYEKI